MFQPSKGYFAGRITQTSESGEKAQNEQDKQLKLEDRKAVHTSPANSNGVSSTVGGQSLARGFYGLSHENGNKQASFAIKVANSASTTAVNSSSRPSSTLGSGFYGLTHENGSKGSIREIKGVFGKVSHTRLLFRILLMLWRLPL